MACECLEKKAETIWSQCGLKTIKTNNFIYLAERFYVNREVYSNYNGFKREFYKETVYKDVQEAGRPKEECSTPGQNSGDVITPDPKGEWKPEDRATVFRATPPLVERSGQPEVILH